MRNRILALTAAGSFCAFNGTVAAELSRAGPLSRSVPVKRRRADEGRPSAVFYLEFL